MVIGEGWCRKCEAFSFLPLSPLSDPSGRQKKKDKEEKGIKNDPGGGRGGGKVVVVRGGESKEQGEEVKKSPTQTHLPINVSETYTCIDGGL